MKKEVSGILLILFITLSLTFIIADEETESLELIDKAYSCLKSQLNENCGDTKSTEQASLSLLAMAYDSAIQSDCKSSLNNKKSGDCWGSTSSASCDLKSTSLGVLALDHINSDTEDSVEWLLEKEKLTTDLDWYLEIDSNEATTCSIKVNEGTAKTFNIAENKKISGSTTCLSPAEQNYFLKISDSCLDDDFTISCDRDFITTLLYKKPGSSVYYVSSATHSASASGNTEEKVNAYCFAKSGTCDYEGSLWAALALAKTGKSISLYIPYITAMSEEVENRKHLPSAFLYMLTNEDDYYAELVNQQKQGKYWEESGKKFYDTSVALLALQNLNIEAVDNTKDYLLEIQDNSGCWNSNNIRDTSFLLYAGWPKPPVYSGTSKRTDCKESGHYCVSANDCSDSLDNFYCFGSDVCCETKPQQESCENKDGIICPSDYRCTGTEVIALDTNYCCLASCIEGGTSESECEEARYSCKTSCSSGETEKTGYECDYIGDICCGEKEGGSWTLVVLLIILIILVILAIIFRNQLKTWWFRIKSKSKFGKPSSSSIRPMPPFGGMPQLRSPMPRQRYSSRRPMRRTHSRAPSRQKDTLFDDTMKKLKDMSK